jgi:genome maintenance exonuclease 1
MITPRFDYNPISRTTTEGKRLYLTPDGEKLASVTAILSKTKPYEDRAKLQEWRDRVGNAEAQRITNEAANVGSLMHSYLENWIIHDKYDRSDNMIGRVAGRMADTVVEHISPDLGEIWGTEVGLYYPGLYAGTTDLAGIWKNRPAIMDFKQSNKPKKREWISDYFCQAAAYGNAHNALFGTEINSAAIFMCSRDCEFQLFEIEGEEFDEYSKKWAYRVAEFYELDK